MPSIVHGYPQIMCSLEKKTNFLCLLYVLLRGHSGLVVSKWFCSTCSPCLCNDCSLSSSCSFSSSFVLTPYFDFSLFLFFCLSFLQYFFFGLLDLFPFYKSYYNLSFIYCCDSSFACSPLPLLLLCLISILSLPRSPLISIMQTVYFSGCSEVTF